MLRTRPLCFAVSLVAAVGLTAAQPNQSGEIRPIRANGVDLSYVDQGTGVPVVFVHGSVADHAFWEPQRAAFAKQFRFVAYTYRYHGTAAWPDDGRQYSADTHAADLAALIPALNAGPVHLVGLSYGGLVAAMVAVKLPRLIRTLTLAEPALFGLLADSPEGKLALEEWNKGTEPMVAAIKAGDNAGGVRHLSALVTGTSVEDFDKLPPPLRQILLTNARTLPLVFAGPPATVTCEMLRGVTIPTLVVRGERTPRVFSTINDAVVRCIAGSTPIVIPQASHAMSYDNPPDFNRTVMDFLSRH